MTGSPKKHSSQHGVALIEVLISILLFSLGILGLIGLQARAITFSVDAEDRNRAALLADDAASTMWLSKSVTLSDTELKAWKARVADPAGSGLANGKGDIAAVSGTTNSADITITWQAPAHSGDANPSRLTTRITLPSP